MPHIVTIGTRGSRLALEQAAEVRRRLGAARPDWRFTLKTIVTRGDRDRRATVSPGAVGFFTSELERALLAGEIDVAVHSLKDVPTSLAEGLELDVVTPRADPRDALVARDGMRLADLPAGATVGTMSPRRAAQVRAVRADLVTRPIRGNVETRLGKVERGEYDAAVLALAGLARLGLAARASEVFEPGVMTPAAGQGILGVEYRIADAATASMVIEAREREVYLAAMTERAVLRGLGGGCRTPVGVLAETSGPQGLRVTAFVGAPDGARAVRLVHEGVAEPEALAGEVVALLRERGAEELIE